MDCLASTPRSNRNVTQRHLPLLSLIACCGLNLSALVGLSPAPVRAQSMEPGVCPPSGSVSSADLAAQFPSTLPAGSACRSTPSRYEIKVYKMALCTADPIAGATVDLSSCQITYDNPAGQTADLYGAGGSSTVDLSSLGSTRPANGSYGYAYIQMQNTFGLRNEYATTDTTYKSSSALDSWGMSVAKTSGSAENYTITMSKFGGGAAGSCSATVPLGAGSLSAELVDSSLATINYDSSGSGQCPGSAYITARMALNTPVTISDNTLGLAATFSVTNNGSTVIINDNPFLGPIGVNSFDGGPFEVTFRVVE